MGAAAIAAIIASPAYAGPNVIQCYLMTAEGDHVSYAFEGLAGDTYVETAYAKNGWSPPNHRPVWTRQNDGLFLVSNEAPDWGLAFQSNGRPDERAVQLTHNGYNVGTGTCVLSVRADPTPAPTYAGGGVEIPLRVANGENWIEVGLGGREIKVWGIVDTGATLVSMSSEAAQILVNAGQAHWSGETQPFTNADGQTSYFRTFYIHNFHMGRWMLKNVLAVEGASGAPFLIGMSALNKLGAFKTDVARGTMTFE
jgi:hypothetical protein